EARAAGLEAIDGDDERSGPSRGVVAIGMEPAEKDAVLDPDCMQLAGANAAERHRRVAVRLLCDRRRSVTVLLCPPEPNARRKEVALPRMRADGVPEPRFVVAAHEPVRTRVLHVGDADRQLVRGLALVVHDRLVDDRRPENAIPPPAERRDQDLELGRSDDRGRRRRAHTASLNPAGTGDLARTRT